MFLQLKFCASFRSTNKNILGGNLKISYLLFGFIFCTVITFCRHVVQTDDNRHDFTKFRQNTETTTSYDVFTNFFFSHFAVLTQQQYRPGSLNTWKQTEDFKNSWTYRWLAAVSISSGQRNLMKTYHNDANTSGITKIALIKFLDFFWERR